MADNSLSIILTPQFVVNVIQTMDSEAGFTVLTDTNKFVITAVIGTGGGVGGNVYSDEDKDKLAAIEALSTGDQTGAEIKTLYEGEANTNEFSDAEQTKLANIADGATDDQTGAEIKTLYQAEPNAYTDAQFTKLAGIEANATADQSDIEIRSAVEAATDSNVFTDADHTKLDTVETAAKDDQTGAEIKVAYEGEANTNAYTDTEKSKLAGIEVSATADQTDAEIKTAYEANSDTNAFSDALIEHYGAPLATTTILTALAEASLNDKERRFVEAEISDYFYDVEAGAGDFAPDDQTGGTGFWLKIVASGDTAASIKTKYESNANTNEFDDAEQSKLAGIEASATADQTDAEIRSAVEAAADSNIFTDAENTKLNAIEASATIDQTDAEIRAAVEAATDSNVFTDADHTKLDAIESAATIDQTDAEIQAGYEAQVPGVSGNEMTAGTEVADRRFSPDDIENMIQIHAPGGGGSNGWTINDQTGTSYTLVVGDAQKLIRLANASAIALTIPTNANEAFAIGDQVRIAEFGAGTVTIDGAGVTLNVADDLILGTQHEGALLIKVATDEWDIIKDLGGSGSMTDAEVKTAYENNANTNEFDDAEQSKLAGIESSATADQTDAEIETAYNARVPVVSGAEMTAGTEALMRRFSPDNIENMIDIHGGGGGGGGTAPTRTIVTLSGSTVQIAIPDGVTWFRYQSKDIVASGTGISIFGGLRYDNNTTDEVFSGDEEVLDTALTLFTYTNEAPMVATSATGGGTDRSLSGTVYSPRDATKKSISFGHGLAHGQPHNRNRTFIADVARDDDTVFFSSTGTFTGTIEIEWFYDGGGSSLAPTRTRLTISGATTVISIPKGVTWFRFQSGTIIMSDTTKGVGVSVKHGADVTQLFDGTQENIATALTVTRLTGETALAVSGSDGGTANRSVYGTVWAPRDASKFTITEGCGVAHGEPRTYKRVFVAQLAEDDHTMTFTVAVGTMTGTIDFEWFYDGGESLPTEINAQTGTSYTLAITDSEDIVEMDNASANVLTIPLNSAVAFPIGTIISIVQIGAGATSITGDTGVTLNGVSAGSGAMSNAFDGVSIFKRGTNEWVVHGAIGTVA